MRALREVAAHPTAGGILLVGAALLALVMANSPLAGAYKALFAVEVEVRVGTLQVEKPLLLWINDGLMAVFFFLVGLELKREVIEGELSSPARIALPAFAALGGMLVPALVYHALNRSDPVALRGWAIPTATDIAFSLGVLGLAGTAVPNALKLFLVTLAIVDDIGAIVVIALFFTSELSTLSLGIAGVCCLLLLACNRAGVRALPPYLLIGLVMWLSVLKSGVHATLAGVLLAMFIPSRDDGNGSPLRRLEHDLQPTVTLAVLPLFALANCGVSLAGAGIESVMSPVPLGVAAGLVIGKPLGVLAFSALAIALGLARLPGNVPMFAGVACLTGIGFTMSLFIGSLAFGQGGLPPGVDERIGILLGSALSAVLGLLLIRRGARTPPGAPR
jgi:NhaA family Na+:H+ antiporter